MARLEFELAAFEAVDQHFSHYALISFWAAFRIPEIISIDKLK